MEKEKQALHSAQVDSFVCKAVSFGNPALGVYHGTVYFLTNKSTLDEKSLPLVEDAVEARRLVALVDVPPEQVPEGVLNLARAHRTRIQHVRVVISESDGKVEGSDKQSDFVCSGRLDQGFESHTRSYLVLVELATEEAANEMVEDLHLKPFTCLDDTQTCNVHRVIALKGEDGVSLMSPYFAPAAKSLNGQGRHRSDTMTDDYHCAVCLEHLELEKESSGERRPILTTVCNHSFHLECLLQWQDSPCPVCRYDHAGLNEALSRCHECGTTENNYVCLICGVVSCGGITDSAPAGACTEQPRRSQVSMSTSHARKHYDETLHTYALDTESQHVWDFAGQGYVHRLLQSKDDGKLVEVVDPNNVSQGERASNPGLSEAQEGEIVHRKLEGFASQYYTLLKSQLEQQRIFYEGRLDEIRHEFDASRAKCPNTADLVAALKQERRQLEQRAASIRKRSKKAQDDVTFLCNMNESLEANKELLKQQVSEAQQERQEIRDMFHDLLPPLKEKVTRLMLQLENETIGG